MTASRGWDTVRSFANNFGSRRMDRLEYYCSWAMVKHQGSEHPNEEGMKSERIECTDGKTHLSDAVCKEIGDEKSDLE